jgi:hypothetical protein
MEFKKLLKYFLINIFPILLFLTFIILFFANVKSIEGFSKKDNNTITSYFFKI